MGVVVVVLQEGGPRLAHPFLVGIGVDERTRKAIAAETPPLPPILLRFFFLLLFIIIMRAIVVGVVH